jgi:hypothetical protein
MINFEKCQFIWMNERINDEFQKVLTHRRIHFSQRWCCPRSPTARAIPERKSEEAEEGETETKEKKKKKTERRKRFSINVCRSSCHRTGGTAAATWCKAQRWSGRKKIEKMNPFRFAEWRSLSTWKCLSLFELVFVGFLSWLFYSICLAPIVLEPVGRLK